MKDFNFKKKYPAFTLLELLIVISIITVLLTMSVSSFGGLRNTMRMNEYMLNLEQDIRTAQRTAMLVERDPTENWLYGIGIDFSEIGNDGDYKMFKWCSAYPDYGHITTRSNIPGFIPTDYPEGNGDPLNSDNGNGKLPIPNENTDVPVGVCDQEGGFTLLAGYAKPMSPPMSNITFGSQVRYVLFESVSGRTFLYNDIGEVLNYDGDGNLKEDDVQHLTINFKPLKGTGKTRKISVMNLSGKIDIHMTNEK